MYKLKRITFFLLISLGIITIFFWFFVTSPIVTNTDLAIKLRYVLYFRLAPKIGYTLDKLPFEIITFQSFKDQNEKQYIYMLMGKFVKIEINNQLIFIKTKSGKMYSIKYPINSQDVFTYEQRIDDKATTVSFIEKPLFLNDTVTVQWIDSRPFHEINSGAILGRPLNEDEMLYDFWRLTKLK